MWQEAACEHPRDGSEYMSRHCSRDRLIINISLRENHSSKECIAVGTTAASPACRPAAAVAVVARVG